MRDEGEEGRRRMGLALIVLVIGAGLTFGAVRAMMNSVNILNGQVFMAACEDAANHIENRVQEEEMMLRGGAGYFRASDEVTRSQWRRYANTLASSAWVPGLAGFGYAALVPRKDLAGHLASVRAEGFPNYRVWPPGDRPSYAPILFLEPFSGPNLRAFGYDLLSEPVRREALEKARDEGLPAMTGKLDLVQDGEGSGLVGLLLLYPIYQPELPQATVYERRRAIMGWVYCPIRMEGFMTDLLPGPSMEYGGEMRIRIVDKGDLGGGLLFDSDKNAGDEGDEKVRFSEDIVIPVADRSWTLEFRQSFGPAFSKEYENVWAIGLGGTVITLLVFWLVLSLLNTSYRARRMAKKLNAEVLALNEGLERRVAERTAELEGAKSLAEEASKAKSEFLSSMSHELRTPMNSILGFGQLLERDKGLGPDQSDFVREILKAGHHLLELINEVLDLSRIDTGKVGLSLEPVACAELVEEAIDLLAPLADKEGISLKSEVPVGFAVLADRFRLKQILVNLLSNAIKYNREGGSVRVLLDGLGERLRLAVVDTGYGIPESRMAELFLPFNRLGREAGEIEGTGIGLVISKKLIEFMGGDIGAESVDGSGSSFWVELPSSEATVSKPPFLEGGDSDAGPGRRET
ncbi:MAG TPA: CHASE domain-containing protein, partial [Rectinemataceae bacterium]|nr:CHASE domain-containing protein [Rectinemataceae bacterium]